MTPTHDHLRRLFELLLDAAPKDRRALLDQHCAGDAALRHRLEAMLLAAEKPDNFLASVAPDRSLGSSDFDAPGVPPPHISTLKSAPAETPGTLIGRYKLLQKIGEGGFGAVFLAEQREPVARKVALKIIKLGMDTRQVIARFEAERQALALMDHPNIARVLDAGATDSGRPYFVMEYVKGDPIIAFADAHKLSLPERLDLFTQVCQAVQHAHTKGVIHRDLKPGNILVSMSDGKPFARVIDFGIAKATGAMGGRLTDKTLFTEHHQLIGTPEYMSPEQAEGSPDIDTRTDVYSLGVLLYELLTGATPFDAARLRSAAFAEMQRIIKEEDPPSPSLRLTRRLGAKNASAGVGGIGVPPVPQGPHSSEPSLDVVSAARRTDPARLGLLLKGELDWIVMKALEKDRSRRYESPSQLAADVQRHLAGEPVEAAPPSAAYRLRKFVRRNKGPVLAGSSVATVLFMGVAGTTFGFVRADQATGRLKVASSTAVSALEEIAVEGTRSLEALNAGLPLFPEIRGEPGFVLAPALRDDVSKPARFGYLFMKREVATGRVLPLDDAKLLPALADMSVSMVRHALSVHQTLRIQTDAAEWSAYTANLALAQSALTAHEYPDARRVLGRMPEERRGWEYHYLALESHARDRHFTSPDCLAVSRDGDWALVQSVPEPRATHLQIVETATGTRVDLPGITPESWLGFGEFSASRNLLFTASSVDGHAQIWATRSGKRTADLSLRNIMSVGSLAEFSPTENTLVTIRESDSSAMLWSVPAGSLIAELKGHEGTIHSVAYSTDGSRLVTTSNDGTARVWNAATGSLVSVLTGHSDVVRGAAFNHDGSRILTVSDDKSARFWDTASGAAVKQFPLPGRRFIPRATAWDSDRAVAAIAYADGTVEFVDSATFSPLTRTEAASASTVRLSLVPGGDRLVLRLRESQNGYGGGGGVFVLPVPSSGSQPSMPAGIESTRTLTSNVELCIQAELASTDTPPDAPRPTQAPGLTVTTGDNTRRIVGSTDRTIRFIDIPTSREVAVFRMPEAITTLALTPDSTRLIISLADGSARIWDIRNPAERQKDIQREWAERTPANEYLTTLWNSPTPTDKLRQAIIDDPSLSPLRRLVAVELNGERLADLNAAVASAEEEITKSQTDKSAVLARARTANLPPRVLAAVVAELNDWEYTPPQPSTEARLLEETKNRKLADARTLYLQATYPEQPYERARELLEQVVRTRLEVLGPNHPDTAQAKAALADVRLSIDHDVDAAATSLAEVTPILPADDVSLLELRHSIVSRLCSDKQIDRARTIAVDDGSRRRVDTEEAYALLAKWRSAIAMAKVSAADLASAKSDIERAVALIPKEPIWTSAHQNAGTVRCALAGTMYRSGDSTAAMTQLEVAAKGEYGDWGPPADALAFLAMSHFKLNHPDQARAALDQLRAFMSDPAKAKNWAIDPDALALLAEAESLIDPPKK